MNINRIAQDHRGQDDHRIVVILHIVSWRGQGVKNNQNADDV